MAACSKIMPPFQTSIILWNNSLLVTLSFSLPDTSYNLKTCGIERADIFKSRLQKSEIYCQAVLHEAKYDKIIYALNLRCQGQFAHIRLKSMGK